MPTIVIDSTKRVLIKNPLVKSLKDSEGSPITIENPIPVDGFTVSVENAVGNFGEVTQLENGDWEFNPGDEIDGQASGDWVYTGTFQFEGEAKNATGRQSVELQPGAPEGGTIEPELEVE